MPQQSFKIRGILILLFINVITGIFIYYGGDAYHKIGLAGLGTAQTVLGYILGIIQFVVLAILVQRLVESVLLNWLLASTLGSTPPRLLHQLSAFFIYILAFAAIIGVVFKKDLTVILAASGAFGVVIGLALKSLILDIFAGLAINLDQTIKIGNFIKLHKAGDQTIEGRVEEVSWRTMRIIDLNDNTIILPNRIVSSSTITNFSNPNPTFAISIYVTLDSRVPVERAIRILKAAAIEASMSSNFLKDLSPFILVKEIIHVPKSVKYNVVVYPTFETRGKAYNFVQQYIIKHLDIAGIRPTKLAMPEESHIIYLLQSTKIFNGLSDKELQALLIKENIHLVEPNKSIILGGEVATSMFLILEGLLAAEVKRKIGMKPLPDKSLSPGHLVGGKRMVMGDVYATTVMSKTESLLLEINHHALENLFTTYPQTAQHIARNTAKLLSQEEENSGHWQVQEADLEAEILRNLKNMFALP